MPAIGTPVSCPAWPLQRKGDHLVLGGVGANGQKSRQFGSVEVRCDPSHALAECLPVDEHGAEEKVLVVLQAHACVLCERGRGEREEHDKAVKAAAEEMAVVRNQIADRDVRIQALEGALREATLRVDNALAQLGERTEELAKVSLQLKDTRLELDVTESGSTVTSSQISQLQRERDELAALVEQLRPRRQVSRPFA